MGDIDRGQAHAGSDDPVGQLRRLWVGQKRIDQQGLLLAVDQRGRIRYPFQIILAGRNPLGRTPALPDEQLPLDGFRHWRTTMPKTYAPARLHESSCRTAMP